MALKDDLKASIDDYTTDNVVDFEVEKLQRKSVDATQVMPDKCLALAMLDCKEYGDVIGVYVTLIRESPDSLSTENYRAGLDRAQEIAYRQLGVQEAIERWKE